MAQGFVDDRHFFPPLTLAFVTRTQGALPKGAKSMTTFIYGCWAQNADVWFWHTPCFTVYIKDVHYTRPLTPSSLAPVL